MRILLTGSLGRLGVAVGAALSADGHDVVGFDRASGQDLRDVPALEEAAKGASTIVHLAGLADDRGVDPSEIVEVNVLGTFNVLRAAESAGAQRVIFFSSGKALGMVDRPPRSLPLGDEQRLPTFRAYGLSKWLAEEMCQTFTEVTGITTICLRPVAVLTCPEDYEAYDRSQSKGNGWHLGAYVDLADVVSATRAALVCPDPGHVRLLLCADDIAGDRPTAKFVQEFLPDVPWDGGEPRGVEEDVAEEPRRALVDSSVAHRVLGWQPSGWWAPTR